MRRRPRQNETNGEPEMAKKIQSYLIKFADAFEMNGGAGVVTFYRGHGVLDLIGLQERNPGQFARYDEKLGELVPLLSPAEMEGLAEYWRKRGADVEPVEDAEADAYREQLRTNIDEVRPMPSDAVDTEVPAEDLAKPDKDEDETISFADLVKLHNALEGAEPLSLKDAAVVLAEAGIKGARRGKDMVARLAGVEALGISVPEDTPDDLGAASDPEAGDGEGTEAPPEAPHI